MEIRPLIPPDLLHRSGRVFYSGAEAFEGPRPLYLLGLNPGGDPAAAAAMTIGADLDAMRDRPRLWSSYLDDSWRGRPPGSKPIQRRVTHLLSRLGLDPRATPASNVIFEQTRRAANLGDRADDLMAACWPVHAAVLRDTGARVIVCMGRLAGDAVRARLGAHTLRGAEAESNARGWRSTWHSNAEGLSVVTLPHPAIADWAAPATDPTPLVLAALHDGAR